MTADRVHYNLRLLHLCCTEGTSHAYFSQPDSDHQPCKDDDDHHQPCNDGGDHICPYMQVHLQHQLYRYILSKLTRQKMSSKVYAHNMQVHLQHQYFCPNISRQNIYSQVYAHLCRCISSINFKISRQTYLLRYMPIHICRCIERCPRCIRDMVAFGTALTHCHTEGGGNALCTVRHSEFHFLHV